MRHTSVSKNKEILTIKHPVAISSTKHSSIIETKLTNDLAFQQTCYEH